MNKEILEKIINKTIELYFDGYLYNHAFEISKEIYKKKVALTWK